MPILDIEIVVGAGETLDPALASRLAEAAGVALPAPPGSTWVRLRELAHDRYAESGGGPPEGVRPVFVEVLAADPPQGEERRLQVARLTAAIATLSGRPSANVHVIYQPPARGRVAFGGGLVGG